MNYSFTHYVNTNSYDINFQNNKYSIFYDQIKDFKEYINIYDNNNFIIDSENLLIQHILGESILNSIFEIKNKIEKITINFTLQSGYRLEKDSNNTIFLFKNNEKILTFYSSILTDSVGNYSPENNINISQNNIFWSLNINFDEEWINNPNTIYPLKYQFDTVFSSDIQINSNNIQMLSSGTDQVYSDVREDSATQFYITFYDDSQFKRPKAIYQGLPVCSTVPYAVGDVYNLTESEIQQWYDGLGDEERDVYLQIIASKVIDANKKVYYDVYLPGAIDYRSQVAEFVDFYGGSPIYRGVFKIYKNNPPSYIDGIGYLNVYLNESKYTDLMARMTVIGVDRSVLYGAFTLGTYGPWSNISKIPSTIDVSSLGYGVSILESTMDVILSSGEGVSVLPGIIQVDLPTSYGAKIISGRIDVKELGRKFLSGIMSVTSNYGISSLNANMTVEGISDDITPVWYDAKNFRDYNTSLWTSGEQIKSKEDYNIITDSVSFSEVSSKSRYLTAALDTFGNAWCWGRRNFCGIGALSSDTSLQRSPVQVSTSEIFSEIYSDLNTIARNTAGELWFWGEHIIQDYGDFNTSPFEFFSTPTLISGASNYDYFTMDYWGIVAQDTLGDIYRFGDGCSLLDPPSLDSDFSGLTFVQIVAGVFFIAGLDAAGSVWFAGKYGGPPTYINEIHPAEMISGPHTFIKIAAGTNHLLGLKADGSVWGWGAYGFGQLGLQNYTGDFFDFTDYNNPILINSGLNIVDISAGQFTSLFLDASGKLYSTGISVYNNRNNFGADAELGYYDISSVSYAEVSGNKTWLKINAGDDACVAIDDNYQLYSWGAGSSSYFDNMGQGKIGYRGKSSPGKVKFFDQDLWGGFTENTISTDLGVLQLPRLSTRIYKSSGNVIIRPDYNDLVTSSYLADIMNSASSWSDYSVWADYYKYMSENIFDEDVYHYFKYLHMMLYADSDTYSNFKQKGQFMKPLYQMSSALANGIQYHFADLTNGINIEIDYINRSLTTILSPFNTSYSLYSKNWSEEYVEVQAAVYAEVKIRDVTISGSITDYTTNSGLVNLSSSTNKIILQMAGLGSGSYDITGVGGETYPVAIKLIFQPSMRLYKLSDLDSYDENIYGTYHFVAPTTSIEISNIKIYPRRNVEI